MSQNPESNDLDQKRLSVNPEDCRGVGGLGKAGDPVEGSDDRLSADSSDPEMDKKPRTPKMVRFTELATCGDEIWIEHGGQIYRLRRTRQDKLILTK